MATRKLVVEVVGDASSLSRAFRGASADTTRLGGSLGRLSVGFGSLLKGVLIVDAVQKALEGLSEAAHLGIEGFTNTTRVAAQTDAVIKSTGASANVSAKQVHALAASLSNVSGIDDEVIQSGENVLLSFGRIRDFAGKNNDIFTQATKIITDYASRTGKAMSTSATIIGRALADPATKAVALSRAGIVLTKSQLDGLKALQKTSGVVASQEKLLQLLRARYEGAAAAAGRTLPGQLNILRERFKDLAGELVGDVLPAFSGVIKGLTDTVVKVTEASGFHAKLNIVWTGIQGAAKGAESAIGDAIAKVDWDKVWASANGIADGLQKRLQAVNWSEIGSAIGDGIAKAVSLAASAAKPIAEKIQNVIGAIDFVKIGKAAGPGLAAALVTAFVTITDPTFWIKNWELALAVGSVAFGGPLGRLGGRLAAPFAKLGIRLGEDLAVAFSGSIERLGGRLAESSGTLIAAAGRLIERFGAVVLTGFLKIPGLVVRALAPVAGLVTRAFGRLGALTRFTIKVLGVEAVINTITHAVSKIAGVFSGLAQTIGHALDGAWKELERGAIKAALAIVEPFTHIPNQIVGHKFQDIKASLQTQLDGMVTASQTAVASIQSAFASLPKDPFAKAVTIPTQAAAAVKAIAGRNASAGFAPAPSQLPPPPAPPPAKGLSASQRNTFFDNAISSDLTRAGLLTNIKAQIAALQNVAGLISARLAATKDVTRRRNLEDQLLSVESQIKGDQLQAGQEFLATLQFGITKAQATATFKDDIAAFTALENGIKAQIRATGETADLKQQLFDAQQGLKAAKSSALSAKDFKILGFGPTGDDITPGLKRLRTEFASVSSAISGTSLDTSKVRTELAGIKAVITDSLVPQDVRAKMQALLADLEKQLKGASGPLTKTTALNSSKILSGLGLSPADERTLRARLSHVNSSGKALAGTGAGSKPTVVVQAPDVYLDGKKVTATVSGHQRKTAARNPSQRRGPNAGRITT